MKSFNALEISCVDVKPLFVCRLGGVWRLFWQHLATSQLLVRHCRARGSRRNRATATCEQNETVNPPPGLGMNSREVELWSQVCTRGRLLVAAQQGVAWPGGQCRL